MKLYATVTSERASRIVRKGGDQYISIEITSGNRKVGNITIWPDSMQVLMYGTGYDEKRNPIVRSSERILF